MSPNLPGRGMIYLNFPDGRPLIPPTPYATSGEDTP